MAKISMTGRGSVEATVSLLRDGIQSSGVSCELIDSVSRRIGGVSVYVMVFEKYFMRASNRASLTVVVSGEGGSVSVDAIGSGGGQGALFRFSWGAEESFVGVVSDILSQQGFRYA